MSPKPHPASVTALLLALALCVASPVASATRNILFIAIDDMRVDSQAITPTLDALAAQATVYSNAYTTAVWCVPSRTSVMFGLSPATHQVGLERDNPYYQNTPAYAAIYENPDVKALPEVLSAAGYTTAVAGKVFHKPEPSKWDVNGPSFEWWMFYDEGIYTADNTEMPSGPLPAGMDHPDWAIADWAEQFLLSSTGPFFLAIGFSQPHLPWIAPQWAWDMYPSVNVHVPVPGDLKDEPVKAREYADHPVYDGVKQYDLVLAANAAEEKTRGYLAAITHTDAMIGQVLAALEYSGHADDTDVIIWSDHGFHLGEKFHWRKRTYWQQSVRVPLIIKSANIETGIVATEVSLLDLAPTVLDLAGVTPDPEFTQFEGVSLRTGHSPVAIYDANGVATVTDSLKTIDYDVDKPGGNDRAKYDLAADPGELTNLLPPTGC